jgi:hypothetical protein
LCHRAGSPFRFTVTADGQGPAKHDDFGMEHVDLVGQIDAEITSSRSRAGAFAANVAVVVGYQKAGKAGAIVASVAVVLPSLPIVLMAGKLPLRFRDHQLLKSAFHGLRPAVTGMFAYMPTRRASAKRPFPRIFTPAG